MKKKRYYHMIIQRLYDWTGETRREYISTRQGSAPDGWKCVAVCGYHEKEMSTMAKKTPCDYGECPYDAQYAEACRVYCGLGVDVACDEDEEECCGYTDDDFERAYRSHYGINDCDDYSPSAPWLAPGLKISDFI